jgi:hypothetical protein
VNSDTAGWLSLIASLPKQRRGTSAEPKSESKPVVLAVDLLCGPVSREWLADPVKERRLRYASTHPAVKQKPERTRR